MSEYFEGEKKSPESEFPLKAASWEATQKFSHSYSTVSTYSIINPQNI